MKALLRSTALGWLLVLTPLTSHAQEAGAETMNAGAYLAARTAGTDRDFADAAKWYATALQADPENALLQEGTILSQLAADQIDAAIAQSQALGDKAQSHQVALIALLADQAQREDFAAIIAGAKAGHDVAPLLDDLTVGWAHLGAGRMSDAQAAFDKLAERPEAGFFALFHKALALASVGDFEGAEAIYAGPSWENLQTLRRAVLARAQGLSQLERNPEAVALLDQNFAKGQDPEIDALRARLEAGEPVPFDIVTSAKDGIAEVFFTLAVALNGEADDTSTLVHARIAGWLRPDHTEAHLMAAGLLNRLEQPELAMATYARIAPDDPAFHVAEVGRARALLATDQTDTAIEVLTALARSHGQIIGVQQELGTALRNEERFAEAVTAYDAAIALLGDKPKAEDWGLFFMRGICHERLKQWDLAEPDFRKALELSPNQPSVLNYLGYSLLEMNTRLDEAMALIEQAVAAEPEAGYIVDSLAWGYYRLGRYKDALAPMEKASLLEPVDPVVTDHLGDVYWANGRQREARFQWRRALSFEPEEKDAIRIRRKLEVGLDAVLAEEGAKPLGAETANGN